MGSGQYALKHKNIEYKFCKLELKATLQIDVKNDDKNQ